MNNSVCRVELFGGACDGEYHEQTGGTPCPEEIKRERDGIVYIYRLDMYLFGIWGRYVFCGVDNGGIMVT
jgi:hypothetical protein